MTQDADHSRYVRSWMDRVAKDASAASLVLLFEAAWNALWRRAERAVGQVTLESIGERVLSNSMERYPILCALKLEATGISCKTLLESAGVLEDAELKEGLRFMLTEFLTVLGDLTDQILTPGLHQELSRIAPGFAARHAAPEHVAPDSQALRKAEAIMSMPTKDQLMTTGIRNLDEILAGGIIRGSSTAVVGPPGSGKTILAQQISFHNATPKTPVVYFSTLSEPGAKTLFYLNKFGYFDPAKIDECVHFVDLGVLLRAKGLQQTLQIITKRLTELHPSLVMVDSFRVFEDLAASSEELRKFSYELVLNLMTRKCTTFFLGEYAEKEYERNPLYSIIDGLVVMTQRELSGEQQRFIQVVKMRGVAHSREEHIFRISTGGIEVFAPRLTIKRSAPAEPRRGKTPHCQIGIQKLDDLLGGGIPRGSSLLIAGVAGTGKTVLGLEFIYRGAQAGEKGILFSFEETDERLRAAARSLGWDLDTQIERGMVDIVFIPQPDILVEQHLLMMRERIAAMGAARVAVDSLSVFLHKIKDPQIAREKVFQLASIVQNTEAVGFFATDIPYGTAQISRFGVEETVVDGVIILSSTEEGLERQRYIEVYKLRNTAHLKGRHSMTIDTGGIHIFPRYRPQKLIRIAPPLAKIPQRLSCGIAALDKLLGSGLMTRSLTLISGSSGTGKSILALHFLLEGASRQEPGLLVTLEEGPEEIIANADALGLPLQKFIKEGLVRILYLPPTYFRSTQLLAVLTDTIKEQKTRRLVLDSTTHIVASGMSRDNIRELLYDLVVRFKNLGVTCLFTLESDSLYTMDFDVERGFSALADNIVMLRYAPIGRTVVSSLMVIKTRGSKHDTGLYSLSVAKGGLQIGASLTISGPISESSSHPQAQIADSGRRH